jgi:dihydrolipoamide dehydrogenase
VELDLQAMQRRKEKIVQTLATGIEGLFKQHRVTRLQGRGRLAGPGRVVVTGEAGEQTLEARHVLIATGSRPAALPGIAFDGERVGSSSEALGYREVPGRLVVIGAGYIGLELGSVWRRLGSQVVVLEALDRILPGIDAEMAAAAAKIFEKQGLEFRLGVRVERVTAGDSGCLVQCRDGAPLECDRVLVAVGRLACTADLGLETAGIEVDARGEIPVGDGYQTSAAGVYAIGDCIAGAKLAHKASHDALACVDALAGAPAHPPAPVIPAVVYTHPELATVGQTEEQLQQQGRAYRKGVFPFQASGRARTLAETRGSVKVLADARTDRLLGVHILGPRAGDLIAEAAAAMQFGASAEDLASLCHAHPTLSETLGEAALAVHHRAIHIPPPPRRG